MRTARPVFWPGCFFVNRGFIAPVLKYRLIPKPTGNAIQFGIRPFKLMLYDDIILIGTPKLVSNSTFYNVKLPDFI